MSSTGNRRAAGRRRRSSALVAMVAVIVAGLSLLMGVGPAAASDKDLRIGDEVTYSDGSPAPGVKIVVYEAENQWTRGVFLGSTTTDGSGIYGFAVGRGCYITVAIAPLGTSFDAPGSGEQYDQQFGCVDAEPNLDFDSVLYRDDVDPEPPVRSYIGDNVSFSDGTPAPGVTVTVYEAINRWTRGAFLGSEVTDADGNYSFDVTQGCYITVAIALPDTSFVGPDAGIQYDSNYGCVENDPNLGFDSILYRNTPLEQPPVPVKCGGTGDEIEMEFEGIRKADLPDRFELLDANGGVIATLHFSDARTDADDEELEVEWPEVADGTYFGGRSIVIYQQGKAPSDPVECKIRNVSPIALDLDGSDAVERISGEFSFDFDANGEAETVSEWFAPTEGILIDTRIAGPVSGAHLFGDQGGQYANGFEKLALLDGNSDGQVAGTELTGLAIWTDANSNAMVDTGEITSLPDHDVVALSTSHTNMVSEATLADGSKMMTEDLWFPAVNAGAAQPRTMSIVVSVAAMASLLAAAFVGNRRRRDNLDAELTELLEAERIS